MSIHAPMPAQHVPNLARYTTDQYHEMIRRGDLREGAPIELLDGLLVRKDRSAVGEDPMGINPKHAWAVYRLQYLILKLLPFDCYLQTQLPLTITPDHEPEPDGMIIKGPWDRLRDRIATPSDLVCVIEVSDSSLQHDRTTKLRIYAAAGIGHYAIVNLVDRCIEVYSSPNPTAGAYNEQATIGAGEVWTIQLPDSRSLQVPAAELLP